MRPGNTGLRQSTPSEIEIEIGTDGIVNISCLSPELLPLAQALVGDDAERLLDEHAQVCPDCAVARPAVES